MVVTDATADAKQSRYVTIFAVNRADPYIEAHLPRTPIVRTYPNGHREFVYRNVEPLPPNSYWWLDFGDGHQVSTEVEVNFDTEVDIPAFPFASQAMSRIPDLAE